MSVSAKKHLRDLLLSVKNKDTWKDLVVIGKASYKDARA